MYVYIMTNKNNTVFYTSVTNDLHRRIWEHKNNIFQGFTANYNLHKLVYFVEFDDEITAITYEKKLKKYYHSAKCDLISKMNPNFNDLAEELNDY